MYKMNWQQEIDLANLPKISFKTPFEQAKSTAKFLFNFSKKWVNFAWKTIKNIHKNRKITIRELSENIGLSLSAIDKNLLFLKDLGILERMKGAEGGYWVIHFKLP